MFMEIGEYKGFRRADDHDFGFLRIQLKVNEINAINDWHLCNSAVFRVDRLCYGWRG